MLSQIIDIFMKNNYFPKQKIEKWHCFTSWHISLKCDFIGDNCILVSPSAFYLTYLWKKDF